MPESNVRALILVAALAVASLAASANSANALASSNASPSDPCSTHPTFHSFTRSRIDSRFDPSSSDTANANYLRRYGLTGIRATNVVAVSDSSRCASAIVAYASLSEPANSLKRQQLRTQLKGIVLYRLAPNRYVLNAGIANANWGYEMFVTDSGFRYVSNYF